MILKEVNLIAKATKSRTTKEISYVSTIFKQTVFLNADEDLEVSDHEYDINLKLDIPVHTFESFIDVLVELRENFDVACAYTKEPITHENHPSTNDIVGDKNYSFAYWDSIHKNYVLYSNYKEANVFIYIYEFKRFANLYVYLKRNN
ncbi:hypothetical protein [Lysinibacillus sphaericus]|uniref:hypothetical protein n=1 Tax=Lysinibacillus sphaericus TaxID=1421 RepID=UPI000C196084|nr:hypothetical protein [Lysinibacillus sphaericus]PIJ98098.1 hypothetical protein CTN02_10175 [Lysinibacillus sphaericus]